MLLFFQVDRKELYHLSMMCHCLLILTRMSSTWLLKFPGGQMLKWRLQFTCLWLYMTINLNVLQLYAVQSFLALFLFVDFLACIPVFCCLLKCIITVVHVGLRIIQLCISTILQPFVGFLSTLPSTRFHSSSSIIMLQIISIIMLQIMSYPLMFMVPCSI